MAKPKGPLPESLEEGAGEEQEYGWIEYVPENMGEAQKLGYFVGLARAKAKRNG